MERLIAYVIILSKLLTRNQDGIESARSSH